MIRHFVFDAYGTLFDVHSAAGRFKAEIGPDWERMSQIWRTKHLEYTWIHAQTGRHISFRLLAERSLDYASRVIGGIPDAIKPKLMQAYETLSAYPEVPAVLAGLKARGATLAILTNGDPDMIDAAVKSAGLSAVFDHVFTVHEAGIFKPDARVYRLVTDHYGVAPETVSFQSSNRWDVAGAQVFGFRTVWVNRGAAPDEYPDMPAGRTMADLKPLADDTAEGQPPMTTIDYYISLTSPWTYLGSRRFMAIAKAAGAGIDVKPAKFGAVFEKTGGLPLARRAPERRAYRMLELKRWRAFHDRPLNLEPKFFPADEAAGTRAVLRAKAAGLDAVRLSSEIGCAVWEREENIADAAVLAAAGERAGIDLAKLQGPSDADLDALHEQYTTEAIGRGVFGAPSYALPSGEIFWGQDRLDFLERALAKT